MTGKAEFQDDKFIVIPTKYLSLLASTVRGQLNYVLNRVRALRVSQGKGHHPGYYVVRRDEPYANEVLKMILKGEEEKSNGGV